jgi:hypothetical protein
MKALIPIPICETCGRPCKRRWRKKGVPARFCAEACVPRQLRVENGRRGRVEFVIAHRLGRYRGHLTRLRSLERITAQELIAVFAELEAKSWDNGYAACEDKWLNRTGQKRRRSDLAVRDAASTVTPQADERGQTAEAAADFSDLAGRGALGRQAASTVTRRRCSRADRGKPDRQLRRVQLSLRYAGHLL